MTEGQLEEETLTWRAELSDNLLPRLISGQLRLPEPFDNQGLTTT